MDDKDDKIDLINNDVKVGLVNIKEVQYIIKDQIMEDVD